MSRIRVIIDGETLMDGDPGSWSTKPPAITDLELRATSPNPEPWIQLLTTVARACVTNTNHTITATTRDNGGWTLDMEPEGHGGRARDRP